jgi:hypothetical protein
MTLDYAPRAPLMVRRISCVLPTFNFLLCTGVVVATFIWGRSSWHIYAWQGNLEQRAIDRVLSLYIRCCSWFLLISVAVMIQAAIRRDLRGTLVVAVLLIGSGLMLAYATGVVSQAYE